MTLTLTLSANLEQKLQEMAAQNGQDTAAYALSLIEQQINSRYHANGSLSPIHAPNETYPDGDGCDNEDIDPDALAKAIAKITNRTPEQIAEARGRLLALSTPPRPLPPGKTFAEVVAGQWPGDETDEEVQAALDELS